MTGTAATHIAGSRFQHGLGRLPLICRGFHALSVIGDCGSDTIIRILCPGTMIICHTGSLTRHASNCRSRCNAGLLLRSG